MTSWEPCDHFRDLEVSEANLGGHHPPSRRLGSGPVTSLFRLSAACVSGESYSATAKAVKVRDSAWPVGFASLRLLQRPSRPWQGQAWLCACQPGRLSRSANPERPPPPLPQIHSPSHTLPLRMSTLKKQPCRTVALPHSLPGQ